jgi:UDP-N-acetylglucosamine transferase subunit ALG13
MAGLSNRQRNKLALRAKREERKLRKAEARAKREAQQQHQQQLQQALTVEQVVDDKTLTQMCGNKATVADTSAWRPFSLQPSIERALITKVADISTDH